MSKQQYLCPVCGYYLDDRPGDFNICPCCGVEFGYQDANRTHAELREEWIRTGMNWWSTFDQKPEDYNPYAQLARLEPQSGTSTKLVAGGIGDTENEHGEATLP